MVTTADTYRHFAEECLRWAEETHNEEHRQACLDMAVVWLRLAATGLTESFKPAPPRGSIREMALVGPAEPPSWDRSQDHRRQDQQQAVAATPPNQSLTFTSIK